MRIMIVSPESFIKVTLCAGKTKYKNSADRRRKYGDTNGAREVKQDGKEDSGA